MNGQHLYSAFLPSAALSPSAHFSCLITSFLLRNCRNWSDTSRYAPVMTKLGFSASTYKYVLFFSRLGPALPALGGPVTFHHGPTTLSSHGRKLPKFKNAVQITCFMGLGVFPMFFRAQKL